MTLPSIDAMRASALILHVEDDPIDVGNLRRAFSRCGIANPLRAVPSAAGALTLLRDGPEDARLRPSIILLDLGLPEVGGLELLRELKADPTLRSIPVVVFSASRHDRDLETAYRLGAAGYVVKPMDFEGFVRAVGTVERYWTLCEIP
jgi:CheY-like chemotaxis protein